MKAKELAEKLLKNPDAEIEIIVEGYKFKYYPSESSISLWQDKKTYITIQIQGD